MLAIAGGKGGTGKTTTALALARELARAGSPVDAAGGPDRGRPGTPGDGHVLVVDADVDMPDVHAMASVERTPTVLDRPRGVPAPDLCGVRVAPAPPADATRKFGDVLRTFAAGPGPPGLEDRSNAQQSTADESDGYLSTSDVVVDAPCGAGPDAALPLSIADGVVLVTRPTPTAVRDTAKTAAMARALDTPLVAAAVVGATPARSLADVLEVPTVVPVPFVDGDPLRSRAHRAGTRRLASVITGRQTPF